MRGDCAKLVAVLLLGGILFLFNLGGWDLWNPDEPRYAQVAKEMLLTGNFLVPHLNGETYYDKPPLFFALVAASSKVWGNLDAFAARFPSAFFAILTLLVLFLFGRSLEDAGTGLLSSLVLATSFLYFWLSRRANIDATLTFLTTLSVYAFFSGARGGRNRWRWYLLGFVAMALGFLVKLQPALIVPFLAIVPYFLIKKGKKFFLDKAHLPGVLAFSAIIGGWLWVTYHTQGHQYLQGLLWEKTASTFFRSSGHDRPIYYYLYNFPLQFMPWGVFFPFAFAHCLRKEERTLFPLLWFSLTLAFFSLSEAKRALYLLPLYPAASLMVGTFLRRVLPWKTSFRLPVEVLSLSFLLLGVLAPIGGVLLRPLWPKALGTSIVLSAVAIPAGLILRRTLRAEQKGAAVGTVVVATALLYLISCWRIFPAVNPYKSYRPLCEAILSMMGEGDTLAVYRLQGAEINFYTGKVPILRVYDPTGLKELLSSRRVLCVMRSRDLEALKREGVKVGVVLRRKVGGKDLVVITNEEGESEDTPFGPEEGK